MLPELTEHGAGSLTSSKYFGKSGLDALSAMLHHADRYGLKWVFVSDPYYEPLLVFAGWRKVDTLEDQTISVWSKDDVPPATPVNAPQMPPPWQGLMWGILPIGSSILAMLFLLIPDERKRYQPEAEPETVRQPARRGPRPGEDTLVMRGWLLALTIVVVTAILITIGTLWPVQTAIAMAAPRLMRSSSSPKGAVQNLMQEIRRQKLECGLCEARQQDRVSGSRVCPRSDRQLYQPSQLRRPGKL